VPFILGGAMGPVTTAGAIAQAHAEAMVGVALTQLVRPGAPVVYGNFLSSMSLKSGAPTFGMPEPALANLAVGQLARRLGVPLRCGGALTASKLPDYQAGQESADALMPALLCGANFILHGAGWMEGALVMDYEKFMLDAEHLGMMHVFLGGLALDDNAFALDAFRENGPGKHFFDCAHTMANYETAFFDEQWQERGGRDARTRASAAWKKTLAEYEAPPLDEGVDEALREYVARKKGEMPDKWY
jgi:trimethylamine--corrinoid protein Co-methyltransferase